MCRAREFACAALAALALAAGAGNAAADCGDQPTDRPIYLTFDTGHMQVAPLVAEVLKRHDVRVTFFLANERTKTDGASLDDTWAPWWKARVAEGHAFGSHTFDHTYWVSDTPGGFRVKPSAGPHAGRVAELSTAQYCAEIERSAARFQQMTGAAMAKVFRAPGGKTSPKLLDAARACGWAQIGWSPAGFLGDELPSEKYPNAVLLERALRDIRPGDILLAHLGIWSRVDAWAPANLEPLIVGLKSRGLCFATLREHPAYRAVFGR
jgi:peptidoglycan-N-acetylmuramic acid deacetylase